MAAVETEAYLLRLQICVGREAYRDTPETDLTVIAGLQLLDSDPVPKMHSGLWVLGVIEA